MAFDNSYTAVTGATYQAADYNTHTKGNFTAIWVGTTSGDMEYYSSATAKTRLPKGTALQVLRMNSGATAPEWATFSTAGLLHTSGLVTMTAGSTTSSTSLTDVSGMSLRLTLTKTCSVFAMAFGQSKTDDGVYYPTFALNINGTVDSSGLGSHRSAEWESPFQFVSMYKLDSVPAGSCVVKLQYKISNATDALYVKNGRIIAMAFES